MRRVLAVVLAVAVLPAAGKLHAQSFTDSCDLTLLIADLRASLAPASQSGARLIEAIRTDGDARLIFIEREPTGAPQSGDGAPFVEADLLPAPTASGAEVERLGPEGLALVGWRSMAGAADLRQRVEAGLPLVGARLLVGPEQAVLFSPVHPTDPCIGIDVLAVGQGGTVYLLQDPASPVAGDLTADRDQIAALLLSGTGQKILGRPQAPVHVDLRSGAASARAADWVVAASPLARSIPVRIGADRISTTRLRLPRSAVDPGNDRVTSDEIYYLSTLEEETPWKLHQADTTLTVRAALGSGAGATFRHGISPRATLSFGASYHQEDLTLGPVTAQLVHPFIFDAAPALFLAEFGLLGPDLPGLAGTLVTANWQNGTGTTLSFVGARDDGASAFEVTLARHGTGFLGADGSGVAIIAGGIDRPGDLGLGGYLTYPLGSAARLSVSLDHTAKSTQVAAEVSMPLAYQGGANPAPARLAGFPRTHLQIDAGDAGMNLRNARILWEETRASMRPAVTLSWEKVLAAIDAAGAQP